jgi:tRNA-specific 2-thiouridylase
MKVLVAMSGGVDSSVAAALLIDAGHEVTGATMKLWGGPSDSGCCSVADVEDARRVAQQLGIDHHVFNFTDDFDAHVVEPYVAAHGAGRTPNPCIECNRHLKFDRFLDRARRLGFDAIATGHHARITRGADGGHRLRRGADAAKDQSYVLAMLGRDQLASTLLPVGEMTKDDVRTRATALRLRTADKPDSQDVCFIMGTDGGRSTFLGDRIPLHPGKVIARDTGEVVGQVDAVELVTVGQRRGLGVAGGGELRFAVDVDTERRIVTVGSASDLLTTEFVVDEMSWTGDPVRPSRRLSVQFSAHGNAAAGVYEGDGRVVTDEPVRRPAPGQTAAFYDGDVVLGAGTIR